MDPKDLKAAIQAEVNKNEAELRAKKLLLKQLGKKRVTPFIETKTGRGWNYFLVFVTNPAANVNHNARRKLEHPREWRCEQLIKEAERLLKFSDSITLYPDFRTNKVAIRAAKLGVRMAEFTDLKEYKDQVERLRKELAKTVTRLRVIPIMLDSTEIEDFLAGGVPFGTAPSKS